MNTPPSNQGAPKSSIFQQIWYRIRRIGVEMYAFFTTPFVLKNCLGMVSLMTLFLMLTFWWMKCYTNHGESVEVPSYEGMSFREAAKKARSRDFGVAVSDSIYVPGEPPGKIVSQDPKPKSRVKEGRTIYFTVTKNNPDILKLPNLKAGDDYEIYSRRLARIGLKPRIVARAADPGVGPNTIIAVIYKGDTITEQLRVKDVPVEMGATIDFVVSEEVTLTVIMPDCVCHTLSEAKFKLQVSELSIGAVIKDATVTDEENAYVWRQSPKFDANGTMRKGEKMDLYITQNKPSSCASKPDEGF
ncbi:MAG: PASTA domain-containing protein [Chitinophagales bacterium]|nr:PASTA domain-containing protein [Chitinophagales bacterium]